jgi:hypothetical protein
MRALTVECNADKIAARVQRMSKLVPEVAYAVADAESRLVFESVKHYSSLTDHSLKLLATMGHPYATAHPFPPHAPYLIHRQGSGGFWSAWGRSLSRSHDGATATVYNRTPYAGYLQGGTKYMIARPILTQAVADAKAQHSRIYSKVRRIMLHGAQAPTMAQVFSRGGWGAAPSLQGTLGWMSRLPGAFSRYTNAAQRFL